MKDLIPNGVWPTMLTPYTQDDEVDYDALEALIEWYIGQGADGLFAVCQSSEMYYLSLEERVKIAGFVKEKAADRVPVIASGHISDEIEAQVFELRAMADTGIDALVLISNHFAKQNEGDEVWKKNAQQVLKSIPDIPLGIYECPVPYKRLMTPELLRWCAKTERFLFLKDTCCNVEQLRAKKEAVRDTPLKIFNANSATILESLKIGIEGFSGVMANFHPALYTWLIQKWDQDPIKAQILQGFLGMASLAENHTYPVNAKYYLSLEGVPMEAYSRANSCDKLGMAERAVVEQMQRYTHERINKEFLNE